MTTSQWNINQNNPFPGPVSLSIDQPVFGRDEEIANLRGLLLAERVVVLHGVSGAGKSSLLRGRRGICDRFEHEKNFSVIGPIEFRLPSEGDGGDGFYEQFLLDLLNKDEPEERQRQNTGVWAEMDLEMFLIRRGNQVGSTYQLLILDQFEDMFTQFPHDEKGKIAFFSTLGTVLDRNPNLRLLLAMREEYLGELDHYRKYMPGRFQATFRLELLRKREAIDAILLTAKNHVGAITLCTKDVENLVDNLSQVAVGGSTESVSQTFKPGYLVEPLFLQLACRDAWTQAMQKGRLVAGDGGDSGTECLPLAHEATRGELDEVLARFYCEAIGNVCSDQPHSEYKIRSFVQDGLISTKGLRNLVSQDQANQTWGVSQARLTALVEQHLIRVQKRNLVTYYELAHDRLVDPVRANNELWFANCPAWRRTARHWHLGSTDVRLRLRDLLRARNTKRQHPDSLTPFESTFIAEQKRASIRRFVYPVIYLISVAAVGVFVAIAANRGVVERIRMLESEADQANQQASEAIQEASLNLELSEKAKEEADRANAKVKLKQEELRLALETADQRSKELKLKEEEIAVQKSANIEISNTAAVFTTLGGYVEHKWIKRHDQGAVLQVAAAYRESLNKFSDSDQRKRFDGALFTAFNNSLTSLADAPGFSRALPHPTKLEGPVAFHGGALPMMASVEDGCVVLSDLRSGAPIHGCLQQNEERIERLQFDPAGRNLALSSADGLSVIEIPDARDGGGSRTEATRLSSQSDIDVFLFSGDGQMIAFAQRSQIALVCRQQSGWRACGSVAISLPPGDEISALALSNETSGERMVAVGLEEGSVSVWQISRVDAGSSDSDRKYVTGQEPLARIGKPPRIYTLPLKDRLEVIALHFLNDKPQLLIVHEDTQIFLATGGRDEKPLFDHRAVEPDVGSQLYGSRSEEDNDHYAAVAITTEGILYTVLEDTLETWDFAHLREQRKPNSPWWLPVVTNSVGARHLRNLAAGDHYLIAQGFFNTWVWERGDGTSSKLVRGEIPGELAHIPGSHVFYPQAVAFGADGALISGTTLHGLQLWKRTAEGGWAARELGPCGRRRSVRGISLSPDRKLVAAASSASQLMVVSLDRPDTPILCDRDRHSDGLWSVAFSHDGRWLASGDWAGKVMLWEIIDGNRVRFSREIPVIGRQVRALAFSPKENLLAVGMGTDEVHLFSLTDTGEPVSLGPIQFSADRSVGSVLSLAFSSDGALLSAAGSDGPIQLWRINRDSGKQSGFSTSVLPTLVGHAGGTRTLSFNPKRNLLASGGADGLVRIWDVDNPHRSPALLRGVDADVLSIAWDNDGKRFTSSFKQIPSISSQEAAGGLRHGKILTWSWDLEEFASIACDLVWSTAFDNESVNPCDDIVKGRLSGAR